MCRKTSNLKSQIKDRYREIEEHAIKKSMEVHTYTRQKEQQHGQNEYKRLYDAKKERRYGMTMKREELLRRKLH